VSTATCLLAVLLLAGCATGGTLEPVVVSKGHGLATVSVQPVDVLVIACRSSAGERLLGCVPSRMDTDGLTIFFRLPPPEWGVSHEHLTRATEIITHELCHGVHQVIRRVYGALAGYLPAEQPAALRALVARFTHEPCHDEDGGVIAR